MQRKSRLHTLEVIKAMGIARPLELEARGVTRAQLSRLVSDGLVIRQSRGLDRGRPRADRLLSTRWRKWPSAFRMVSSAF